MRLHLGQAVSKSSGIPEYHSYDEVALEYYDTKLHPTCADFRVACRIFLEQLFKAEKPQGRMADVGCGKSLLSEFVDQNLVLVDASAKMLSQNAGPSEKRLTNIEVKNFGVAEFDWIFAILADPFNSITAWKNIGLALKENGRCVFVVPSYKWVSSFRVKAPDERSGFAHFVKGDNSSVYLPSAIYPQFEQESLIAAAGLYATNVANVSVGDLPVVRSPKISEFLTAPNALIDVYRVQKH
jgi:SAM-dependent methyltransferase